MARASESACRSVSTDDTKLVNVGSNRWSIKPEIGASKAFGRWTLEVAPAVTIYTDNDDFFGGQKREQAPLYSVQAHLTYTFRPGCWVGLDAGYFNGSRSTVNGVENDDRQEGARFGATLAFPLSRNHSLKLYAITGCNAAGITISMPLGSPGNIAGAGDSDAASASLLCEPLTRLCHFVRRK